MKVNRRVKERSCVQAGMAEPYDKPLKYIILSQPCASPRR